MRRRRRSQTQGRGSMEEKKKEDGEGRVGRGETEAMGAKSDGASTLTVGTLT